MEGLTEEDFKKMDKSKAEYQKMIMDEHNSEEKERKENMLFMGMSDEEILVNKGEFIALGLMWLQFEI